MSEFYTRIVSGILFPLHERLKHHDSARILPEMELSQWWPPQALQELQLERLRAFLTELSKRVPFYRNLFREQDLQPGFFQDFADLRRLPITDKSLIRAQGDQWLADGVHNLINASTSGSSGEPLPFKLSRRRVSMDIAAKWRATRWWDVDIGDRELVIWASAIETGNQDRLRALRDRILRSHLVPAHNMTAARMDAILADIRRLRPRMLFGYPSALARLAWHAQDQGIQPTAASIRVAFTTSEVLQPQWRTIIGDVFGCGVANEYGARDAGLIARECPAGGLHLNAESLIVEVVDATGRPSPPGEVGDILVTNLMGPEFPFLRYRTGDRGRLDDRPCDCGRSLPLLRELTGRSNDGLIASEGHWIHASAFNAQVRALPGLRAYKIVQEQLDQVVLELVLDAELSAATRERLRIGFQQHLGTGTKVRLRRVASIEAEANGKFRHVVCRVKQVSGPAPASRNIPADQGAKGNTKSCL
ncbi:phenylacetate--CoA ligase family protein [Thiorhodococcus mannitoliphagus]|uniref:phenylacetate--CoA ligase family protein n=1 Tax=Thiorhodococcus mannitoliphagus TaxID=329406 RepID=UPI001F11491B|nr:AMP-binding protein [Thiorhodococcus mannitoliphagus]